MLLRYGSEVNIPYHAINCRFPLRVSSVFSVVKSNHGEHGECTEEKCSLIGVLQYSPPYSITSAHGVSV